MVQTLDTYHLLEHAGGKTVFYTSCKTRFIFIENLFIRFPKSFIPSLKLNELQ